MELSLWSGSGRSWPDLLANARWARGKGFRAIWMADHLMPARGDGQPHTGDSHECWTMMAAVAATVPDIRVVSMVSPVSIHHPVVLLKRAVDVDQVSGGRAELGLGAGWQVNEHAAYGFDLLQPKERVDRFEEAIEIVHRLRREESVSLDGRYYQVREAPLSPKPVGDLPIVVGTNGPRMLRIAARWADVWNSWGVPDLLAERTDAWRQACEAVGRDPATMRRSAQVFIVREGDERVAHYLERFPDRTIGGSTAQLVDAIGRFRELGVDEFGVHDGTFAADATERVDQLEALYAEVLTA